MRILIAAKYVPTGNRSIGGVQSWIKTVRAELEARGNTVVEWQPGMFMPVFRFDFGIFANTIQTRGMMHICDRTLVVSHGIIPDEQPAAQADAYAFVSEGVRNFWGLPGPIIRQPIDLAFWRPGTKPRFGAVRYSYRRSPTLCESAARHLRLRYEQVGSVSHDVARDILARSDLVFASGRAALEAMACGAPTVIYDHRSAYQGPLMGTSLPLEMQHSYSGRSGSAPTLESLVNEARKQMDAGTARKWVEDHHDAADIVDQIMATT